MWFKLINNLSDVAAASFVIEGMGLVEEVYTDIFLINWLFWNSIIENKFAGCIVSGCNLSYSYHH